MSWVPDLGSRRTVSVIGAALLQALLLALLAGCGSASSPTAGPTSSSDRPDTATPVGSGVLGRVTDRTGAPVPRATVSSDDGTGRVAQSANVTGDDGRYFLPLPPGTWRITIAAPGREAAEFEVEVRDEEQVEKDVVLTG